MDQSDSLADRLAHRIRSAGSNDAVILDYRCAVGAAGLELPLARQGLLRPLRLVPSGDVPDTVVFLDIETTGLNSGAGTLVFLIGLAFVDETDIVVEQYFLHEPAAEAAVLGLLARRLAGVPTLVTFNGKSFDVPMLIGRYDLHRLGDPLPTAHIDLLHPARRIWGRRLRQSSLGVLEARVLGVTRERDVPGAEVPRMYFEFLRGGSLDSMVSVLEHNRDDLLAMVGLAGRIDQYLGDPRRAESSGPSDLLGLGTLFESLGKRAEARHCYAASLEGASLAESSEALFRLATLVDRAADLDEAIELFAAVALHPFDRALLASVELAKIHEHRTGNHDQAMAYANHALALVETSSFKRKAGLTSEITQRITRLERKAKRRGPGPRG